MTRDAQVIAPVLATKQGSASSGDGTFGTNRQIALPACGIESRNIRGGRCRLGRNGNANTAQRSTGDGRAAKRGAGLEAGPRRTAPRCSTRNGCRSEMCFCPVGGSWTPDLKLPAGDMTGSLHASKCKLSRRSPVGDSIRFGGPGLERGRLESNAREANPSGRDRIRAEIRRS